MSAGKGMTILLLAGWAGAGLAGSNGSEVYKRNCETCHGGWGGYGAPGTDNYDAWRPSLRRGEQAMFVAVRDGRSSMPPRAGNPSLTDDDLRSAVEWLLKTVNGD